MTMDSSYVSVLHYWFDIDQRISYKTKWFPSDEAQSNTDREIYGKFNTLFDLGLTNKLDWWLDLDSKANLAYIIVMDQFSRHIFRYLNLPVEHSQRKLSDNLAMAGTEILIQRENWLQLLSSTELIFALMPYRHTPTVDRLEFIMKCINEKDQLEMDHHELFSKFRKQTSTRLQHLQDQAKNKDDDDILERVEFDGDETDMPNDPLTRSTLKYLLSNLKSAVVTNIRTLSPQSISSNSVNEEGDACDTKTLTLTQLLPPVVISLSGGVDSMVITRILVYLHQHHLINITSIVAIHIDYANRPESGREADFVEEYCRKHKVIFEKRIINEVTRGVTDRDEYERVAREKRYQFYDEVLKKYNAVDSRGGVIFGHHLGDVQENVISNVMRGSSPLHLSGMTAVGIVNGVNVWRPLLNHNKDEIFHFAHKYGVPYFKDTTPSWSTRGKLRTLLVPLLSDMYGVGCLRNLSNLAKSSDELRSVVHENMFAPFLNLVRHYPCGLAVNVLHDRHRPVSFWKEVLKELMHSLSMSLVREKAVLSFLDRLHPLPSYIASVKNATASNNKSTSNGNDNNSADSSEVNTIIMSGWIELRKGFHSYLTPSGDLIIFKDGVLANSSSSLASSSGSYTRNCKNKGISNNDNSNTAVLSKKESKKKLKKTNNSETRDKNQRSQQTRKIVGDDGSGNVPIIDANANNVSSNDSSSDDTDELTLEDMLLFTESAGTSTATIPFPIDIVSSSMNNDISSNTIGDIPIEIDRVESAAAIVQPANNNTIGETDTMNEKQSDNSRKFHWPENIRFPIITSRHSNNKSSTSISSPSSLKQQTTAATDTGGGIHISTRIGCWAVEVRNIPTRSSSGSRSTISDGNNDHSQHQCIPRVLTDPSEILSGSFSYCIDTSDYYPPQQHQHNQSMDLVIYSQYKQSRLHNASKSYTASTTVTQHDAEGDDVEEIIKEEELKTVSCLRDVDMRLRSTIPLLVPLVTTSTTIAGSISNNNPIQKDVDSNRYGSNGNDGDVSTTTCDQPLHLIVSYKYIAQE